MQSGKKTYQLQLFSGVEHGFALRGNMDNAYESTVAHAKSYSCGALAIRKLLLTPATGYVKEESLRAIIQWFDFWLAQ